MYPHIIVFMMLLHPPIVHVHVCESFLNHHYTFLQQSVL